MVQGYNNLIVWQKSVDLSIRIYELTDDYPKEEIYGLISQMRRAAVSIPTNIAEGRCRSTKKDYLNFLRISYGSGAELETLIIVSEKLNKTKKLDYIPAEGLLLEVMKMLNSMITKLNPKS